MDDKAKYQKLKEKLKRICNDIDSLDDCLDNLKSNIDNNLSIDGENPVGRSLSNLKEHGKNTKYKIKNNIIPAINNKING